MLVTICQTARRHMQDDRNFSFIHYFVSELVTHLFGQFCLCNRIVFSETEFSETMEYSLTANDRNGRLIQHFCGLIFCRTRWDAKHWKFTHSGVARQWNSRFLYVISVAVSSCKKVALNLQRILSPQKSVKVSAGARQDMLLAWPLDFRQVMALQPWSCRWCDDLKRHSHCLTALSGL